MKKKMTREEEIARLAEIEAMPRVSAKFKATFRGAMERRWMIQDAGDEVIDMMDYWTRRLEGEV